MGAMGDYMILIIHGTSNQYPSWPAYVFPRRCTKKHYIRRHLLLAVDEGELKIKSLKEEKNQATLLSSSDKINVVHHERGLTGM